MLGLSVAKVTRGEVVNDNSKLFLNQHKLVSDALVTNREEGRTKLHSALCSDSELGEGRGEGRG